MQHVQKRPDELRVFAIEADPTTDPADLDGGGDSIADWMLAREGGIFRDNLFVS